MSEARIAAFLGLAIALAPGSAAQIAEKIYYAPGNESIRRANLDGSGAEILLETTAFGLDVDAEAGQLYWGAGSSLRRANLDGTDVEILLEPSWAGAVALDLPGQKIYWSAVHSIHRADLDGTNPELILDDFDGDSIDVNDIAVDPTAGKIYFTQFEGVFRANLNGSAAEQLLSDPDGPIGIALDAANGKFYYGRLDAGFIIRANLDGSGAELVVATWPESLPTGVALDSGAGNVYWADGVNSTGVWRADIGAGSKENIVRDVPSGGFPIALLLDEAETPAPVPATAPSSLVLLALALATAVTILTRARRSTQR